MRTLKYLIAGLVFTFFGSVTIAQEGDCFPKRPNGLVVDNTGTLSPTEINSLNSKLISFSNSTSNQIVVVVVGDLCGYDPSSFAFEVGETWGVGQKEFDNGIVVLVKPTGGKGQRHTFIATGYGLEGAIPDATAKLIIENEMIPNFKKGNIYGGIDAATNTLMSLAKGEFDSNAYAKRHKKSVWPLIFGPLIFVLIFFLLMYRNVNAYAKTNNLGFWAALMMMNAANRSHRGYYGGSRSGGGSSGGGFGGFGGGGFGGGGAGGSW